MFKKTLFALLFGFALSLNAGEGCIEITSTPSGADIEINGKNEGKTPLVDYCAKAGMYVINVKSPCYENNFGHNINRTVKVEEGKTAKLEIKLIPIYQRAEFEVVDENNNEIKDVTLVGKNDETSVIPGYVNMPACKTEIVFAKDGYKDVRFTADISKPAKISVKMIKNNKPSNKLSELKKNMSKAKVTVKEGEKVSVVSRFKCRRPVVILSRKIL
jgi:hypothetical protein